MPELTPAERRGAVWIVLLLLLGALHDLTRARAPRWAPPAGGTPRVMASEPAPSIRATIPGADSTERPTDLNRATVAELDRLPGIGPVLARRIVEHRERHGAFRSTEELLAVPGIGPRLFERLRTRVSTGPSR